MKQGTIKYSQEFISPTGLKRWVGAEIPVDYDTEDPYEVLFKAKDIVQNGYNALNPTEIPSQSAPIGGALPTINREHQRLLDRIDDANTFDALYELEKHAKNCGNMIVVDAWNNKYNQLLKKK